MSCSLLKYRPQRRLLSLKSNGTGRHSLKLPKNATEKLKRKNLLWAVWCKNYFLSAEWNLLIVSTRWRRRESACGWEHHTCDSVRCKHHRVVQFAVPVPTSLSLWVFWRGFCLNAWNLVCGYHRLKMFTCFFFCNIKCLNETTDVVMDIMSSQPTCMYVCYITHLRGKTSQRATCCFGGQCKYCENEQQT